MAKTCVGCAHYRPLYGNKGESYCNYILDTGEPRGCPAEKCNKKISMEEYMKRLTQEQKQEIIRLRIEGNVPVKVIAEKFHLSKSAVFNIISKWKEHGESVISDDEKEPAPAATEASSEQENCVDVPADIIPEKADIVKPVIPEGVWEACRVRIEYLRDLIAEEQAVIDNWANQIKEIEDFLEENKE